MLKIAGMIFSLGLLFSEASFAGQVQRYTPFRPVLKKVRLLPSHSANKSSPVNPQTDPIDDHFFVSYNVPLGKINEIKEWLCMGNLGGTGLDYYDLGTISLSGPTFMTILSDGCSNTVLHDGSCCSYTYNYSAPSLGTETAVMTWPSVYHNPYSGQSWDYVTDTTYTLNTLEPTPNNGSCDEGSIIHTANQTVAENIPVIGTNFDLYYSTSFSSAYVGYDLATQPYFKSNGLTIST